MVPETESGPPLVLPTRFVQWLIVLALAFGLGRVSAGQGTGERCAGGAGPAQSASPASP
jgi:hypothetical protein